MFDVIATGEFYAELGTARDNMAPVDLTAESKGACRHRLRRIDRFTQLALIGSARCVARTELPKHTGLYIGSGLGAVGNTVAVHAQLFAMHKIPKPADFINTLSNSAGYYVARNLDVTAQNVFVSRRSASMEAAFELAALEISSGTLELALIGLVDEYTAPAGDHIFRLGIDENALLAEGSHWFLVRREAEQGGLGRVLDARTITGTAALMDWLGRTATDGHAVLNCGPEVDNTVLGKHASLPRFDPELGNYLSRSAGVLLRYFDSDIRRRLIVVGCQSHERFHVTLAARPEVRRPLTVR